ncbi:branched-chain amino acid ABC transporter substrate-binding protein [Candidatus Palauibacter sp.]|uniref:branched-chain amino acid ABC transporter substrate-binding protein n=1 Tax=Candidatus Palauibacter sp. TaxID=3101350 RepID=UPI003B5A5371
MDHRAGIVPRTPLTALAAIVAAIVAAAVTASCDGTTGPSSFEPGPLGVVTVRRGEAVKIRSLLAMTGAPSLGVAARRGVELAVRDVATVRGRNVELGDAVDSMCSPEGGRAGAREIVADPQIVGVIGTSCSAAAVAASPVISQAGYVMVAPSTTSPLLTSDLAGNPNPDHHPGYFRVANNDLYQARAVSNFAYNQLGLSRIVTLHDGDPYTTALVKAFGDAFRALGGEVPVATGIRKGQTDMTSVLAEFAAAGPGGIFFPLFRPEGSPFAAQARAFDGLEGVTLISGAALLVSEFLAEPQSEGIYFAGPESDYSGNVNEVTGKSAEAVIAAYEAAYGEHPSTPYWALAYDATTLLLDAVRAIAVEEGGRLYLDRSALRARIGAVGLRGLVGEVSCDAFGDCGTGRQNVYHHTDSSVTDVEQLPVVYRFVP